MFDASMDCILNDLISEFFSYNVNFIYSLEDKNLIEPDRSLKENEIVLGDHLIFG